MASIRILSIDGGGIRGIIPARILVDLESYLKEYTHDPTTKLADYFDLIAGTSTGGILTALYLLPDQEIPTRPRYTTEDALNFYIEQGHSIFKRSFKQTLLSLNGVIGAKYTATSLENLLKTFFSNVRLSELVKPCLIPAYDIKNNTALFFNQKDPEKPYKDDFLIRDIVRATTAAPTFFPMANIYSLENKAFSLVDGGVFANNPTLCAYIEATKLFTQPDYDYFLILSLGTGMHQTSFNTRFLNTAGTLQWALPIFNILLSSSSEIVDHKMKILFNSQLPTSTYLRIQPHLNDASHVNLRMDATDLANLKALQATGEEVAHDYASDLKQFAKLLISSSPN